MGNLLPAKESSKKIIWYEDTMKRFKYNITKHPAESFSELVYYCTETGECTLDQIPQHQTEALQNLLNNEGENGWELVQVSFGPNGILAFWKKEENV